MRKDALKNELRTKYRANKTEAYQYLFEIISRVKLVHKKPVDERTDELLDILDELSVYKIKNGIWLTNEDLELLDELSISVLSSAEQVHQGKSYGYTMSFIYAANKIQKKCREVIKKEYYI